MSAVDIPPHSRRSAYLALGALSVIAMAGFAQGFIQQLEFETPPPPPRVAQGSAIAEATAAPGLQVAETAKPRPAIVPDEAADTAPDPADAVPDPQVADPSVAAGSGSAQAQATPAADASATAPAPPAPSEPTSTPGPAAPAPSTPAPPADQPAPT